MKQTDIKELMSQFDQSTLREFSYKDEQVQLVFSKNDHAPAPLKNEKGKDAPSQPAQHSEPIPVAPVVADSPAGLADGQLIESPLVGVAYLSPAPDKPAFVTVGDTVKKGQTLMIIEAMKVMNEIPAPCDGVVTEILVDNEAVIEFGQGLVRIK